MEQEKEWIAYVNGEYIPHLKQNRLSTGTLIHNYRYIKILNIVY